jgi:hypothetical protein
MYNYQQNGTQRDAERELVVYNKLLAKHEALLTAADEGVFQVTIHTDAGAIAIPTDFVKGRGIAIDLAEVLSDWIGKIESNLNHSLENVGEEVRYERREEERKQGIRHAEARQFREEEAQVELAKAQSPTVPAC